MQMQMPSHIHFNFPLFTWRVCVIHDTLYSKKRFRVRKVPIQKKQIWSDDEKKIRRQMYDGTKDKHPAKKK